MEASSAPDVISAETLAAVPEWAKVPPPQPLLPPMPVVVSQHFDDSLVSWQPPEMYIGNLGHAVSSLGPSGLIEASLTRVPEPAVRLEPAAERPAASEDLTLAVSAPSPASGRGAPPAQVRRLSWGDDEQQIRTVPVIEGPPPSQDWPTLPSLPLVSVEPGPAPEPSVWPDQPGEPAAPGPVLDQPGSPESTAPAAITEPVSDLVGSVPLAPPPVSLAPSAPPPPNPLTHASTPPDMPLANLPSSLLPRPQVDPSDVVVRRLEPTESEPVGNPSWSDPQVPAPAPAAAPPPADGTASLIGERAMGENPTPSIAPVDPSVPAEPSTSAPAPVSDLPLVAPPGAPPADAGPTAVEPSAEMGGVEESVGVASYVAENTEPSGADGPSIGMAPLIGSSPPIAAQTESLVGEAPGPAEGSPAPPAGPLATPPSSTAPRSGLGQPMTDLPATARSWDISTMSRDEQLRTQRALMQRQLAAFRAQGAAPTGAPFAGTAQMPTITPLPRAERRGPETVYAGTALPLAPVQDLGPTSSGVVFDQLPPAGDEVAPLVSLAPPLDEEAPPPPPGPSSEGARVRTTLGQHAGVDLSGVPVDRSSAGAAEVRRLGARAMTTDLGIVIPPEVGSLDSGPGAAVFAHELTHVVQRARLGSTLPPEFTGAGRELEAEALSTEMAIRASAPLPLLPVDRSFEPPPSPGRGPTSSGAGPDLPLAAPTPSGPDEDTLVESIMSRMSALTTAPVGGSFVEEVTPANVMMSMGSPVMAMAGSTGAGAGAGGSIQRAVDVGNEQQSDAQVASGDPATESHEGPLATRPSDQELQNLSRWLYPLIRYRLKGELREDRERAGLLTDHYRRW